MTGLEQPEQSQAAVDHQQACSSSNPDFDLDIYHLLFCQDIPHSASSSLELDYPQLLTNNNPPALLQLQNTSSLSLSSTSSSNSTDSHSTTSSHTSPNQPPSCTRMSSSSPDWSSLDQLFLASLPHHPQSSPLFPLDGFIPNSNQIPNPNQILNLVPEPTEPPNSFNHLSDFSFDAHPHDWNLSFDPVHYASSSAENSQEYFRSSDCLEFTKNDLHQATQSVFLQEQGTSPSEQSFEDPNRLTVEAQDCGDFLLTSFNAEPTNFASPPPRQCTPYTPILPMKRMRPTYLQTEDEAASLYETVNLSSITHPNSIPVEQLIQSDQEAIIHQNHPLQPKSKRPKNRTTVASTSKPHICQECGKSFPRLTSLTQHKLTHNGERPFPCGFEGCDKSFTTSSNMKRHWKTHA